MNIVAFVVFVALGIWGIHRLTKTVENVVRSEQLHYGYSRKPSAWTRDVFKFGYDPYNSVHASLAYTKIRLEGLKRTVGIPIEEFLQRGVFSAHDAHNLPRAEFHAKVIKRMSGAGENYLKGQYDDDTWNQDPFNSKRYNKF